ncbi:hypothetical protein AT6N2_C0740 [Agrobacterium tumefaciens]|uniref:Uncharacterized protein n=1 Tax=Agrobacterium tumefaciens TaxID=358 RepID=A0A176XEW7_AGRTU|nr:hypothetical protein [Agrobacterium tumefaciens]OAE47174.1 hypothetical protein A7J57_14185 [Agrobacterium tumefaciens]QTK78598.1 hypothetical protein AT6N2_C0740 [Agrobacterium tumefaciens]
MDGPQSAAAFMAAVERVQECSPQPLSATGAAILLAVHLNIAADSRSIARQFGLAHAIVLREITVLSPRFVHVTKRDARTQRSFLETTAEGQALAASSASL